MNASYNIQTPDIDTLESRLFITVSLRGVSFTILNPGNTFTSLVVYDFPANTKGDAATIYLNELFQSEKVLHQNFKRVYIIYAFAESVLVPGEFMNTDTRRDMLELVYGSNAEREIRNDYMSGYYIYNVYGIPAGILSLLQSKFPAAVHTHQYSCLPDIIKEPGAHLYCIFENDDMTVMLMKDRQIQVVQNFAFQSVTDAVYHLLNVCSQYDVVTNEVVLYITGLLKKDTLAFKEIASHFSNIQLEHLPGDLSYDVEIARLPPHYFSHLFSIASCVSSAV